MCSIGQIKYATETKSTEENGTMSVSETDEQLGQDSNLFEYNLFNLTLVKHTCNNNQDWKQIHYTAKARLNKIGEQR